MSNIHKTVDEFIKSMVRPEYVPIIEAFRNLVKKDFPELKEEMRGGTESYYGVPVYRLKRIVVTVSPTKNGITFAFSKGSKFDDKYHVLEGVGNTALNIRLHSINEFDPDIMRYYLKQAIMIDEKEPTA